MPRGPSSSLHSVHFLQVFLLAFFPAFLSVLCCPTKIKATKKHQKNLENLENLHDLEVKIIYICLTLVLGAAPQVILGLTVLALSPFFQYDIRNHREIQRQD